jgi:hypothetical protein
MAALGVDLVSSLPGLLEKSDNRGNWGTGFIGAAGVPAYGGVATWAR